MGTKKAQGRAAGPKRPPEPVPQGEELLPPRMPPMRHAPGSNAGREEQRRQDEEEKAEKRANSAPPGRASPSFVGVIRATPEGTLRLEPTYLVESVFPIIARRVEAALNHDPAAGAVVRRALAARPDDPLRLLVEIQDYEAEVYDTRSKPATRILPDPRARGEWVVWEDVAGVIGRFVALAGEIPPDGVWCSTARLCFGHARVQTARVDALTDPTQPATDPFDALLVPAPPGPLGPLAAAMPALRELFAAALGPAPEVGELHRLLVGAGEEFRGAVVAPLYEGPFNAHVRRLPQETYEEKQTLCKWVNSVLGDLGLAVDLPEEARASPDGAGPVPCRLVAGTGAKPAEGRFEYEFEDGASKLTRVRRQRLPAHLKLVPARAGKKPGRSTVEHLLGPQNPSD